MLNISESTKNSIMNGSQKTYLIKIGDSIYNSSNLVSDSIEIKESICSSELLQFNQVEKNQIKLSLIDFQQSIRDSEGKVLEVIQTINNEDIPLGKYIIGKPEIKNDNLVIINAYDFTVKFDKDISTLWNDTITFPITHRNLLIAICNYCGIEHDIPSTYTNSDFLINQSVKVENTPCSLFIGFLQELSGCFFKPNRQGILKLLELKNQKYKYPSNSLFPSNNLFIDLSSSQKYQQNMIINSSFAEFKTMKIDKLQIKGNENDIGIIVGVGENTYIIESNQLTYGYTGAELRPTAFKIFNKIKDISYTPFNANLIGFPYVEIGDSIQIKTAKNTIDSFVFNRTLKGTGFQKDRFETKGRLKREIVKSINNSIQVLNQKTLEITQNVEKLEFKMIDVADGLQSQITQTSGEVNIQAEQFKYKNLLMNSDFSMNSISETGIPSFNSWESTVFQTYPNAISIVNDNDFPNGKALRINKTVTPTFQLGQTINFQPKQVKTDTLYITFDIKILSWSVSYPSIFPYITYEDGSTTAFAHTIVPGDNKYHRYMMKITGDHIDKTKYIKSINFYIYCWENSILDLLINRIFVTTDTTVPNKEVWNDFAGKDVISQINVSPTTIKIKAQYLDITGFVTFNDLSTSGSTIINGDNIKTGKISAMTIDASYLTNLKSINGVSINATFDLTLPNWDGGLIKVFYNNGIATGWNYTAGTANYVTVRNGANTGSIQLIFKNGLFMGTA